jgi:hypothetical protein
MKPVGQFDYNDPDVFGHGKEHFSEIDHLLFGYAAEFQPGHLGETVNHIGDVAAELSADFLQGPARILDGVMQ